MSKNYSDDLKLIVVEEYLDGKLGYRSLAKKYNISDKKLVRTWVQNYELNGKCNRQVQMDRMSPLI